MKKDISRMFAPIFLLLTVFMVSFVSNPASAIQISSTSLNIVTKSVTCNNSINFSASDFSDITENANSLCLSSLPDESLGVLKIGDAAAEVGALLSPKQLDTLTFCAGSESGVAGMFEVGAISDDGSEKNVAVVVRVKEGINYSPIAKKIELATYKGVSIGGTFKAVDTEGDLLTYSLVSEPEKGSVKISGQNFVYTPAADKRGRDSFSYIAKDAKGNFSEEASVQVSIGKPKSGVTYSDMEGNRAYYASLRLAENNIYVGENLAGRYFFSPSSTIARGEFLAMCMRACGVEKPGETNSTGFADDASIDLWLKPYVTTALMENIISGYKDESGTIVFSSDSPITFAEAAVTLNNILKLSDVEKDVSVSKTSVPTWAYQAAVNLASFDIMPTDTAVMAGGSLTRADAAEMICSALNVIEDRDENSLLIWLR